ncbi:hypothetical protein R2O95_14525, partial [Faecalibacterium duncaniae]|nr:hypothetical protein [Faecalibacterium duncaniae]
GRYLVGQVTAMRSEIFNTSLSAEGRAVLLYHVERMNEESANANIGLAILHDACSADSFRFLRGNLIHVVCICLAQQFLSHFD